MMEAMTMNAAELTSRFRIAGVVEFAETEHGLVKAMVARAGMTGELYLQGAHVTTWQPAGARPVIFTSSRAIFAPGKAIRGGIPVIFPWFGPHPTDPAQPQHGLVRAVAWQLDRVEQSAEGVALELSLAREGFGLRYRVVFGEELQLSLVVRNTSDNATSFEEALHSYFAVSDVEHVAVSGLEACSFIDKTAGLQLCPPAGGPLMLSKETDRVYLSTPDSRAVLDPGWGRRIIIATTAAASTIVWNPWPEKAAATADLGADNWRGLVCVETGNAADNRVHLPAGDIHEMTTRITVDAG
jgi:glucose-6-phosphate 1-epimerase